MGGNFLRGEYSAEVDGVDVNFRYGNHECVCVEEEFMPEGTISIIEISVHAGEGSQRALRALVWGGMLGHARHIGTKQPSMVDASDLIDKVGAPILLRHVIAAMNMGLSPASSDDSSEGESDGSGEGEASAAGSTG